VSTSLARALPLVLAAILVGSTLLLSVLRQLGKVSMRLVLAVQAGIGVVFFAVLGFRLLPDTPALGVTLALAIGGAVLLFAVAVFMTTLWLAGRSSFDWWRKEDDLLRERAAARESRRRADAHRTSAST
jgi:hypothetical protein